MLYRNFDTNNHKENRVNFPLNFLNKRLFCLKKLKGENLKN